MKKDKVLLLDLILLLLILASISFIFHKPEQKISAQTYITERMQQCSESNDSRGCLKESASDFLNRFNLTQILGVLDQNETRPEFFNNCHLLAHYLGREEYQRTGSVQKVFDEGSRVCLGGVLHGAVEGYLIAKKIPFGENNDKIVAAEFPRICGNEADYKIPQYFTECHHGLGHAAMFFAEDDLIRALSLCDALPTENQRELCYTGAFMANADGTGSRDHPSKYGLKSDDPFYPCQLLNKQYLGQCYTYSVLVPYQADLSKSAEICRGVPSDYRDACFQTIGRDRTTQSSDPVELKNQCQSISEDNFQKDCISGAAYNLVIRFGPTSTKAKQFCQLVSENSQEICNSNIQGALKRFK